MSLKFKRIWFLVTMILTLIITVNHLPNARYSSHSEVSKNKFEAIIGQLDSFEKVTYGLEFFGAYLTGRRQFLPFYYHDFWDTGVEAPACSEGQLSSKARTYAIKFCREETPDNDPSYCDDLGNHQGKQWPMMGCLMEEWDVEQDSGNVLNLTNFLVYIASIFLLVLKLPLLLLLVWRWVKGNEHA